ncbi:MAG TPA: peptidase domain-containing ABC transporter [Bacteroides sp.]|nr:peptidase domain-containing ABC transporter [Bacteroides sp.]
MNIARKVCIRQHDSSDCGPACIASVMAFYGTRIPLARIRQMAGTDRVGTSMYGVIRALEQLEFEAKGLEGSMEHLETLPVPFIAHVELESGMPHYVCVYRVNGRYLSVMDPAEGRLRRWSRDAFEKRWSGALVAMVRGISSSKLKTTGGRASRIITLLEPVWRPVLQAIFAAVIYTILGLSTSLYVGNLTDHVFVSRNSGLLNLMSITMVLITLLMIFMYAVRNLNVLKTGQVIDNQLVLSYYRHLFRLPQRFFDGIRTGEVVSRINDAIKIRGFINDAAIGILVNFLILLFSFGLMFFLHWKLALLMLAVIPLYAVIYWFFNRRNRRVERRIMEQSASLESQLVESIQASAHIRQFNLQENSSLKTENRMNRLLDSVFKSGISSITALGGTELVSRLFTIVLLWTGSYFVIGQEITPGRLLTFYALTGYFTGPVSGLIGANKAYQNALIAADRLFEIFQLEPEDPGGKRDFPAEEFGDVVFRNVSFAYGTRGHLFRDLNLRIPSGKVTLISGPSGSGKSTIAALIQHLYPLDAGSITINGYDTRYFSTKSIRALIGTVPQQVTFLTGSILENVAPGVRDPEMKKIIHLLDAVGLLPLMESLPKGLDSVLRGNGDNLSGGERQRLALVRALYRKPSLLILDEATSSLDPGSEYYVTRLLLALKEKGQTILMITHHSRHACLADHILTLDEGSLRAS